jgi:hypothetical protein
MPGERPCPEPVAASDGYCEKHSPGLEKKRLKELLEELARYRWEDEEDRGLFNKDFYKD